MERKKYKLTAACIFICMAIFLSAPAQKHYSQEIYRAYISGDIDGWERVIATLEASGTPTVAHKLELAEYYYAHIGYLLGVGRKKEAKFFNEKAETLIDNILAAEPDNVTATSLKGIFIAYKMEQNKIKAPVLGPQCIKYIKKAHSLDPANIQALSDLGNMYYHCPAVFGGDKAKGMKYLREAARSMENRSLSEGNWFYLNLLTILAEYEVESGSIDNAREIYEKVLRLEPDFIRVKNQLYPRILIDAPRD
ncbi:MAG: hypothetical protein LIO77_02235 [Rikenellaceae bacterium]|nr:hypothetical protein [Rikenellaceae bacterium]